MELQGIKASDTKAAPLKQKEKQGKTSEFMDILDARIKTGKEVSKKQNAKDSTAMETAAASVTEQPEELRSQEPDGQTENQPATEEVSGTGKEEQTVQADQTGKQETTEAAAKDVIYQAVLAAEKVMQMQGMAKAETPDTVNTDTQSVQAAQGTLNPAAGAGNAQAPQELMQNISAAMQETVSAQEVIQPEKTKPQITVPAGQNTDVKQADTKDGQTKPQMTVQPQITAEDADAARLKGQAEMLKQMSQGQAAKAVKTAETGEKDTEVSLDKLQKQVDENIFFDVGQAAYKNLTGVYGAKEVTNVQKAEVPVMDQVKTGLEQGIQKGMQSFSIRLEPEGLGEVIVHMVSMGGKIAMSLGVTNAETQKMLSNEMMNLKEMLKPYNAEVKEVYQNEGGQLDMAAYQQNFYQQQRHQLYAKMHQKSSDYSYGLPEEEEMITETVNMRPEYSAGGLNAYV